MALFAHIQQGIRASRRLLVPVLLLSIFLACQSGSYNQLGHVLPSQKLVTGMSLDQTNSLLGQVPVKRLRTILETGRIFEVYEYTFSLIDGEPPGPRWLSYANDALVHWGTREEFIAFVYKYGLDVPIP